MATSTTNLSLIKPAGTDKIRIAQINQNMDTLDAKIGAVGDTSLQAQNIAQDQAMAILSTGNTHGAISSGQFVYVRSHDTLAEGLYTANSAIASNAILSSSNLTAVSGGGLNSLKNRNDCIIITNEYSTVLGAINAYRNIKSFPFTIQKNGNASYTDLPSDLPGGCEWNVICFGSPQRITALLIAYTSASSKNGWSWTGNVYDGAYILGWTSVNSKILYYEDKTVVPIGNYWTQRDAFKASRAGNVVTFQSYFEITTQVPNATKFASIGFTVNSGTIGAVDISNKLVYPLAVNYTDGSLQPDGALPVGYYRIIGCCTIQSSAL